MQIVSANSPEAYVVYIKLLLANINFTQGKPDGTKSIQIQLLADEFKSIASHPKLSLALDNITNAPDYRVKPNFLFTVSTTLSLTPVQDVVLGLALRRSANETVRNSAQALLKAKLPELIAAPDPKLPEFGLVQILGYLRSPDIADIGLLRDRVESYLAELRKGLPQPAPMVAPLLYPDGSDPRIRDFDRTQKNIPVDVR